MYMNENSQSGFGKISVHGDGVGVPSPEMIERRAREIALIDERDPDDFTDADWEQARRELMGTMRRSDNHWSPTVWKRPRTIECWRHVGKNTRPTRPETCRRSGRSPRGQYQAQSHCALVFGTCATFRSC